MVLIALRTRTVRVASLTSSKCTADAAVGNMDCLLMLSERSGQRVNVEQTLASAAAKGE